MGSAVKKSERGWPGHYYYPEKCHFRRNTLLECDNIRIVVSTVGNMHDVIDDNEPHEIHSGCFYETAAFFATYKESRWEAHPGKQIPFNSVNTIPCPNQDKEADEMHETVVQEVEKKIVQFYSRIRTRSNQAHKNVTLQ